MKTMISAFIILFFSISMNACTNASAEDNIDKKGSKKEVNKTSDKDSAIQLTREEFLKKVYNYEKNKDKWVYEGDKPAIIDFYADWCQPCKIAGPILEEIAKEYEGKIYVYKINTQKERELAAAFGIRSIPTFMLIPMGERPQIFSGIGQTKEETKKMFTQAIDEVLLKTNKSK